MIPLIDRLSPGAGPTAYIASLVLASLSSGQNAPRVIWNSPQPTHSTLPAVEHLAEVDGVVFFAGRDGEHGQELWRSDGTETYLLKDIVAGKGSSFPRSFASAGGKLFFFASDMEGGFRLWCSDGTTNGTAAVAHIPSLFPNEVPLKMVEAGERLFFAMPNGKGANCDVWCSDGTAEGTLSVHFEADAFLGLVEFKGDVLFLDMSGHLWRSDGTVDGTTMLENFPGFWGWWEVAGDKIYLGGDSLWVSDGTPGSARTPEFLDQRFDEQYIMYLSAHGNLLRFTARDEEGDYDWVTDGTLRGTNLLHSTGDKGEQVDWGESIYFKGRYLMSADAGKSGRELWTTKGTRKSTRMLKQIAVGVESSNPANFVQAGKLVFFDAESSRYGREIWSTSGSPLGTRLLTDLQRGREGSTPKNLTAAGKRIFWIADDGKAGRQLWTSDGSKKGTRRLTSLVTGGIPLTWPSGAPGDGSALGLNGRYFFSGWESGSPSSLWRSDGTHAGTFALSSPSADGNGSAPSGLRAVGDRVYFETSDGSLGHHLWASDGTVAGTGIPLPIDPVAREQGTAAGVLGQLGGKAVLTRGKWIWNGNATVNRPEGLWHHAPGMPLASEVLPGAPAPGAAGELLFFTGHDAATGYEPWVSDGTLEGTRLLKDVRPKTIYDQEASGSLSSRPEWVAQAGGKTYFTANSFVNGRELWVTDGTSAGTSLVKDLSGYHESSIFSKVYAWGEKLIFIAGYDTGYYRQAELWISDGTSLGTYSLMRMAPDEWYHAEENNGAMFAELNGRIYFAAKIEEEGGCELWSTDGTVTGTVLLKDINPGLRGGDPQWITATGDAVYFTADDGRHGREMWRTDGTEAGTVMVVDPTEDAGSSQPWGLAYTGGKLFFMATTVDGGVAAHVIDNP